MNRITTRGDLKSLPTVRDVASAAGVSTATVSHVINKSRCVLPDTRLRVEQAIAQLNFVCNPHARSLAKQRKRGRKKSLPTITDVVTNVTGERDVVYSGSQSSSLSFANYLSPVISSTCTLHFGNSRDATFTLLSIIRAAQPISRADIARRMKVKRATVTGLVQPLLNQGVLKEGEQIKSGQMGRPGIGLSLVSDHRYLIGVNIDTQTTQVGAGTLSGMLLTEETFDTPQEPMMAVKLIRSTIERHLKYLATNRLLGIGVSINGLTDAGKRCLTYSPYLNWKDLNLADSLRFANECEEGKPLDVPVTVETDALACAAYEARLRLKDSASAQGHDFLLVRVGMSISVGAMVVVAAACFEDSQGVAMVRSGGRASEFGHMTIVAGGKLCVCGNRGCWDQYASLSSTVLLYEGNRKQMKGGESASAGAEMTSRFHEIIARADAGERRAQSTLKCVGRYLGIGIANAISVTGISNVVVAGPMISGWKHIQEPVTDAVNKSLIGRLFNWRIEVRDIDSTELEGAIEVSAVQYLVNASGIRPIEAIHWP